MINKTLHHWITLRKGDGFNIFDIDWRVDTIDEKGETVDATYVDGYECITYRQAEEIFYNLIREHPECSYENEVKGDKRIRV